jgi:hypothetical protein
VPVTGSTHVESCHTNPGRRPSAARRESVPAGAGSLTNSSRRVLRPAVHRPAPVPGHVPDRLVTHYDNPRHAVPALTAEQSTLSARLEPEAYGSSIRGCKYLDDEREEGRVTRRLGLLLVLLCAGVGVPTVPASAATADVLALANISNDGPADNRDNEVDIAINPTNPQNLVAAWNDYGPGRSCGLGYPVRALASGPSDQPAAGTTHLAANPRSCADLSRAEVPSWHSEDGP